MSNKETAKMILEAADNYNLKHNGIKTGLTVQDVIQTMRLIYSPNRKDFYLAIYECRLQEKTICATFVYYKPKNRPEVKYVSAFVEGFKKMT